ncbi:hypothetical protein C482_11540 [Natrialba chahannaoensis JCM 10990]|uniref:Uncharacterized protein n=1 Tax=Natrialba chahannaoensis JCM 10990 TaxID=1227492 RepID=M0AMU6_9EURY|nr:hypothetical protein [Natrialba chahannaoensis]ELY98708.1 hypothetical protein C482_11540 [Natrialba chahannaoensis JCM 10990]
MKAVIGKEDDDGVGLRVIDNNDVSHGIHVGFDGEIKYHEQDGYPDDPSERTPNENEHVAQAREYARHYVSQETEYEPFPVEKNLLGIKRVRDTIQKLSDERFRELFQDASEQVNGKGVGGFSGPVDLPPAVGENDWVLFMVDVYLNDDTEIEAVSDIHLRYRDEDGELTSQWNDDPFPDRKPDARLQLVPDLVPSVEEFREYLDYHLRCQIRDCYIGAGLEPPEEFKVLGHGINEYTGRYNLDEITLYDQYNKHHAEIPGYSLEYNYGLGDYGKSITKLQTLTDEDDELEEAIETVLETGEGIGHVLELLEERGFDDPEATLIDVLGP